MEPEEGGFIVGPKNLALSLAAFELAWVDGGAATASLAGFLALAPIHERGTAEQVRATMASPLRHSPAKIASPGAEHSPHRANSLRRRRYRHVERQGERRRMERWRGALLQVDKRGRFITNIAFANFVTAAVDSDDPRIKGSCVVILEESDPGIFDRGTPTKKLVHQLSSTGDPIFNLKVPASRIVGGYTVKDGVIVSQLQPQRSDRSGIPPHARDRRPHDLGQAALRRRARHPLSARALPRSERRKPGSFATSKASSSAKTHCIVWSMCGPRAKLPHRSALRPRACSTNSIRSKSRKTADPRAAESSGRQRAR